MNSPIEVVEMKELPAGMLLFAYPVDSSILIEDNGHITIKKTFQEVGRIINIQTTPTKK